MKLLKSLLFPALLVLITTIICALNYTPGTFLTGWDTLHPEFNFSGQFANEFFGAFRTDQGLGAVAAHAHMVELPRLFILWIEHFFLPLSFLRYSIIFACFIAGPLGIFYLVKKVLSIKNNVSSIENNTEQNIHNTRYFIPDTEEIAAFLAALFYAFNLETVQQFYVPFEMFTVQYALLGWLFLSAISFIQHPRSKILGLFALLTLLASPMAYAPVLWYAFFATFLLFLTTFYLLKRTKKTFKSILILALTTLIINSYWFLPNLYFLANSASHISAAQTNKIFSDEAFLYNKQYGNIFDTAIFRNFLFSWNEQLNPNTAHKLLEPWINHLNNPFTAAIGFLAFIASLAGIGISIVRRNKFAIAIIPVFVVAIVMVMNMNPPFEFIFSYLRDHFSLFREGLRFPFTKFGPLLIFTASIFFGVAIHEASLLISKFHEKTVRLAGIITFTAVSSLALIWYGFPMFAGYLIDPQMRVAIPSEYFQLFDYMKDKPSSARVAPLPLNSIWGWEYYDWSNKGEHGPEQAKSAEGYQGAGFLWFGLKQPVLARDFDRWNQDNEQYFREMSNAIYSRDTKKVETLARKYRISYFLLDENAYSPGAKTNQLWHYETKDTFAKSGGKIRLEKKFGNLYLYHVIDEPLGAIQALARITTVGPKITGGFVDLASQNLGDYVYSNDATSVYPSRSFVDRYDRINPDDLSFADGKLILRLAGNRGNALTDTWLSDNIFPAFMRNDTYDLSTEEKGLPYTVGDDTYFSTPINTTGVNVAKDFIVSNDCGSQNTLTISRVERGREAITMTAKNGSACGYISFANAPQDFGSMIMLEAKNTSGLPLRICISNELTARCDIYTALDTENDWKKYVFMVPPLPSGGKGYALHLNNVGIGNTKSINEIRSAQIIQIPYYRIENLSFDKGGVASTPNGITHLATHEINPSLYEVMIENDGRSQSFFTLFKAYDDGWQAYRITKHESGILNKLATFFPFWFGTELKNHVEVNNWANGWIVEPKSDTNEMSVVVVFWPQYLQYAGFAVMIGSAVIILITFLFSTLRKRSFFNH